MQPARHHPMQWHMRIGHPHAVPPDPPVANVHMPQWQMDMRIVTQCPHLLRFQMSHLTLSHMQFVRIPDCTAGSMRPCEPLSLPLAYAPFLTALPVMPPVPPRPSCRNPVGISPPPPPPEPRSVRLPSTSTYERWWAAVLSTSTGTCPRGS
eukprot:4765724-Prymnesium_polylepis.1